MPKKKNAGVFQRLARLRARTRQIRTEIARVTAAISQRNGSPAATDLKLQLREARQLLAALDEALTPLPSHIDVPFGAALADPGVGRC